MRGLVVWAAGVKAPAFLQNLDGLETNAINQLVVRQTLQTTRDEDIFAIGDCAACPSPKEMGRNTMPSCRRAPRPRINSRHIWQNSRRENSPDSGLYRGTIAISVH